MWKVLWKMQWYGLDDVPEDFNPIGATPKYFCDYCNSREVIQPIGKKLKQYCSNSHKQLAYIDRVNSAANKQAMRQQIQNEMLQDLQKCANHECLNMIYPYRGLRYCSDACRETVKHFRKIPI